MPQQIIDFFNMTVIESVSFLKMWMVLAAALVIIVVLIILIAVINKSSTKKAVSKAKNIVETLEPTKKEEHFPTQPQTAEPENVPDAIATAGNAQEVSIAMMTEQKDSNESVDVQVIDTAPVVEAIPAQSEEQPDVQPAQTIEEEKPAPVVVAESVAKEEVKQEEAVCIQEEVKTEEVAPQPTPVATQTEEQPVPVKKTRKPPVKKTAVKSEEKTEEQPTQEQKSAIVLLFGEKPEPSGGKYVIVKDASNSMRPYKFQLKANNGQVLYESEGFKIKPKSAQINAFLNAINNGFYTIDDEKNGTYRYKIFKKDGKLYGVGEGYQTKERAESALNSVKNFAKTANFIEDTTIEA